MGVGTAVGVKTRHQHIYELQPVLFKTKKTREINFSFFFFLFLFHFLFASYSIHNLVELVLSFRTEKLTVKHLLIPMEQFWQKDIY